MPEQHERRAYSTPLEGAEGIRDPTPFEVNTPSLQITQTLATFVSGSCTPELTCPCEAAPLYINTFLAVVGPTDALGPRSSS